MDTRLLRFEPASVSTLRLDRGGGPLSLSPETLRAALSGVSDAAVQAEAHNQVLGRDGFRRQDAPVESRVASSRLDARTVFNRFSGKDGKLSFNELVDLLNAEFVKQGDDPMDDSEERALRGVFDRFKGRDGLLNFNEFKKFIGPALKAINSPRAIV